MALVKKNNRKLGCAKGCLWSVLALSAIFLGLATNTFFKTPEKQDIQQVDSIAITENSTSDEAKANTNSENIVDSGTNKNTTKFYRALKFFGSIIIVCIIILIILSSIGRKKAAHTKPANCKKQLEYWNSLAQKETDSIKKKIIINNIGELSLKIAEQTFLPLIKKWEKLLNANRTQEAAQKLQLYKNELKNAQESARALSYNLMADLSNEDKISYEVFCKKFESLCKCERIWFVAKQEKATMLKSSIGSYVEKEEIELYSENFGELSTPYKTPTLPITEDETCYFYPRFMIVAKGNNFSIVENCNTNLTYKQIRFNEDGDIPSDATQIGTTYRYINKNGGPDRRYKFNPSCPVLAYGEITIEPFGTKLIFSKHSIAKEFCEAFKTLKSGESISQATTIQSSINTPQKELISEQYIADVLKISQDIHDFVMDIADDEDYVKVLDDKSNIQLVIKGKDTSNPKTRANLYALIDIMTCYSKLGHTIDLDKKECLALLLYAYLDRQPFDPKFNKERDLDYILAACKAAVGNTIINFGQALNGENLQFTIEQSLKEYDESLHDKYVVLLYRYASLIAKADGKVTEIESNWLNQLISLKIVGKESITKKIHNTRKKGTAKELAKLIGLGSVKEEIASLTSYINIQQMREEKGMKTPPISYHCVFTGNPGTGKTTVARIVAQIYKELGILKKGHLIETDRSGLVAEYVGQTAVKTNKIIDDALDGVLFIDEAYSLVDGGSNDYGKEAIATLLKRMEDNRDRLVVILAGYTNDMKRFMDANPGLQSRFNRYIEFPDYTADELMQIFELNMKNNEYHMANDAKTLLLNYLQKCIMNKDERFGNGRFIRNVFEKTIEHQASRLSKVPNLTADLLSTIEAEDLPI